MWRDSRVRAAPRPVRTVFAGGWVPARQVHHSTERRGRSGTIFMSRIWNGSRCAAVLALACWAVARLAEKLQKLAQPSASRSCARSWSATLGDGSPKYKPRVSLDGPTVPSALCLAVSTRSDRLREPFLALSGTVGPPPRTPNSVFEHGPTVTENGWDAPPARSTRLCGTRQCDSRRVHPLG
jgi:hypothetical protein